MDTDKVKHLRKLQREYQSHLAVLERQLKGLDAPLASSISVEIQQSRSLLHEINEDITKLNPASERGKRKDKPTVSTKSNSLVL